MGKTLLILFVLFVGTYIQYYHYKRVSKSRLLPYKLVIPLLFSLIIILGIFIDIGVKILSDNETLFSGTKIIIAYIIFFGILTLQSVFNIFTASISFASILWFYLNGEPFYLFRGKEPQITIVIEILFELLSLSFSKNLSIIYEITTLVISVIPLKEGVTNFFEKMNITNV